MQAVPHWEVVVGGRSMVGRLGVWVVRTVAGMVLLLPGAGASGQELPGGAEAITVLTSCPAAFYEPVRDAFEQAYPATASCGTAAT